MSRIKATDSSTLQYTADAVYKVLHDLRSYHEWWPKPFQFTVLEVDGKIHIQNGPLVSWIATISDVKPEELICFHYEGAWVGKACWIITSTSAGTKVEYLIDLEPQPLWLKILQKIIRIGKLHSRQMREVFQALDHRLSHVSKLSIMINTFLLL